ncbi:calcium-binding protein [Shimia sp. SDUM112013]|uniref:calcium-binding protein n=1 Tax=Shimia sp. SDUM112013 TaxID=3136160 RepID=UPI0032EAAE06
MPISHTNDIIFGSGEGFFGRLGSAPASAVLADGRIAVVWNELNYPGDGSVALDFDTWTRILNADGTPATDATIVNDINIGSHSLPDVAALTDGGYVVSWLSLTRDQVEGDDQTVFVYDAHVRSYTAAGAPEGASVLASPNQTTYDPAVYNSILASNVQGTQIHSLSEGGAVLVYSLRGGNGLDAEDGTWARFVANDGQTLGTPVRIAPSSLFTLELAELASGDIVLLAFRGQLSGYDVRISGPNLTSAPSSIAGATAPVEFNHDPQPDQNGGGYGSAMRVAALSDGGFAVAYAYNEQLGTEGDESIRVDRFGADGSFDSSVNIPTADDTVIQPGTIPYRLLGLDGGRLLVAWTHAVTYGDTDIMGVIVNADGSLESAPAVIIPNQTGAQALGDLSLLDNGDVFMTLTDGSGVLVDGVADNLHGVFLELPDGPAPVGVTRDGTSGADVLVGTAANDRLRGFDGNDTIRGLDGPDTLIGDAGDDHLIGGASADDQRDVVYGGAGNDSIEGGHGNDELRGDAGNDTIEGGFGADTVIGGGGNDVLTGSSYGDMIFGGDGDDFVNGGWGHDLVNGGAGADRFFHIGVVDHGSDWIQDYNAADGDVLHFGIASATRDQFQVNTTHTSNAAGERSGDDNTEEAFVIYRPTGQIMWALVDGAGQDSINLRIGSDIFDLMA